MSAPDRRRRIIQFALAAMFLPLFLGATAQAQADDERAVFGQLSYDDEESGEEIPAAGVTIEVDGVGTVETDADGEFRVVVPGPGDYTVTLDVESLPEGVNLRNPDSNPLIGSVTENRDRRVLFPLVFGEADDDDGGGVTFRRFA